MKFQKTCLLLLVLIQLSYQYCHYANQPGLQNGDCSCITGFYSNNQNCQQCPNSSTSPFGIQALNPSDCSICPQGTHYMTQLASQPNQSASCTPCPNNSIFKGDPNSISDQSKCKTCNSGYYKVANAIIPSGDNGNLARAARCQKCPNNTFRFAILIPNMLDALDQVCSQCDDGFYVNSMVPRGQDARCSLCPNNSSQYSPPRIPNLSLRLLRPELPTFTSKDCNVCKLGYYNAETDPTKPVNCQQCPGGTTTLYPSSNNISSCICSQNQYITAISTPSSAASCLPCPTGSGRLVNYFNVVGDESQCDVCLEGYYLITPYQESDGISVAKGAQCQICPQNSYSVAGTSTSPSSCSLCKINFQMTNPADQSNSAQCQPCPDHTGTLAPASATTDVCNVCIAGYYMNQEFDNLQVPQCLQCPPGSNTNPGINYICYCYDQYASWSRTNQSCQCNPGSTGSPATQLNAQGCIPCPAGQYFSSGACVACPAGTYSNSPGSTSCTQCFSGQYASGTGNTSCSNCPKFSTSLDDFTGCKCIDTSAIIKDGNCVCPDGHGDAPSNSDSIQGCQACAAGKYSNSSTSGVCTVCPVGKYATGQGNSNCTQCDIGWYASNTGSSSCQKCGTGSTNQSDFSGCSCIDSNATQTQFNSSCVCNSGYIGSPATSQGSSSKCTACPAGQYFSSGACIACPAGTYSNSPASTSCTQCTSGQYASGTGNTSCSTCPNSTTSLNDFTGCKCIDTSAIFKDGNCVCPDGYEGAPSNSASTQGCQACAAGKFSNSSTSGVCTVCPKGKYAAGTGNSNCTQCDIGWYASNTGSSSCQKCGTGSTNLNDFSGCSCIDSNAAQPQFNSSCVCNAGYIGSPATSQDSSSKCTACPAGQYFSSGACVTCPAGTYSNSAASTSCTKCTSGKYASGTGNTSCSTCPNFQTSLDDFTGCKCVDTSAIIKDGNCVCPDGYEGAPSNSASIQGCQACSAGKYSNLSTSGICTVCPKGKYAAGTANSICKQCDIGWYASNTGSSSCQKCGTGSTNQSDFSGCSCIDTNATQTQNNQSCVCNDGYIGSPATSQDSSSKCTACPAGQYFSSGACIVCPAGTYSNSSASTSCTKCTSGKYASGTGNTSCSTCPNSTTSLNDFTGCKCIDTSAIFKDGNCVCPDGYEGTPSNSASTQGCQACVAGKYSNSTSSHICVVCPVGTYAAGTANSNCKQCDIGWYASNTGSSSCQKCGSGSTNSIDFSSCSCIDPNATQTQNNQSCVCNAGFIGSPATSNDSSSRCIACPAGQFVDSGKCSPCAVGTFSSNTANTICNKCETGQFANGTGNTKCQTCTAGSTNTDDFSGCKCYDSNSVTWNASSNVCQCNSNYYGDASKATETQKSQCNLCPNNSTSKVGAAKTEKDCQASQSQQNSQFSFSAMIKISILVILTLLL